MKKTIKEEYIKTSDICLCSTLCCFDYQIEFLEKDNKSKVVFAIKKDEQLENLIKDYFSHKLKVDPLAFFGFLKEIKTRIYNI